MRAMLLERIADVATEPEPLRLAEVPDPEPTPGELLVRVAACGVCRTDLDEVEGRAPPSVLPRILGHQVVGTVLARGASRGERRATATGVLEVGRRVGIAWIASACGACAFCERGEENLCPEFRGTGRDRDGGYAELVTVREEFALPLPDRFSDAVAAPLLCAGAIGYRSLRLAALGRAGRLGLTGFGASAHLVLQLARQRHPECEIFVFARREEERAFARELGAVWAGDTRDRAPVPLDSIIDTTPAWTPLVEALASLAPGGRLVVNAIRKDDRDKRALLALEYPSHLWLEKEIKSVANVTRRDVAELLELAAVIPLEPSVEELALADANRALREIKAGRIRGAKVLRMA
jgi:propanol-preferring alcohol dehydrogenase